MSRSTFSTPSQGPLLLLALLFAASIPLIAHAQQPTITSFTPSGGSLDGGVQLTILGTNFDMEPMNNVVLLGDSILGAPCVVIPQRSSSTHLECETQALSGSVRGGNLDLNVVSFGFPAICAVRTGCKFWVHYDNTPILTGTASPALLQGGKGEILVTGQQFAPSLDKSSVAADIRIRMGSAATPCDVVNLTKLTRNAVYCEVQNLPAGSHQMNVKMTNGQAILDPLWNQLKKLTPPTVSVVPTVTDVSPRFGSLRGGQRVTITGSGFGSELEQMQVFLPLPNGEGTAACAVERTQGNQVVCVSGPAVPRAGNPLPFRAPAFATLNPAHPLIVELWNDVARNTLDNFLLTEVSLDPTVTMTAASFADLSNVLTYPFIVNNFAVRLTTEFVAPSTGNFTFGLSSRTYGQVELDGEVLLSSANTARTTSDVLELQEGDVHLLRVTVKVDATTLLLNLDVETPDGLMTDLTPFLRRWSRNFDALVNVPVVLTNGIRARPNLISSSSPLPSYSYDAASTPILTQVSPQSSVASPIVAGSELTLDGLHFASLVPDTLVVSIGRTPCVVSSVTESQIRCTVGAAGVAGTHQVLVRSLTRGLASGSFFVTGAPTVTTVSPSSGSLNGGTTITVSGSGFDATTGLRVTTGGVLCAPVVVLDANTLTCVTGAQQTSGSNTVEVTMTTQKVFTSPSNIVASSSTGVPSSLSNSVNPTVGASTLSTELEIFAADLSPAASSSEDVVVRFVQTDQTASTPAPTATITFALGQRILCMTPPLFPGVYRVEVQHKKNSATAPPAVAGSFTVEDVVTSWGINMVGPYGGLQSTFYVQTAESVNDAFEISYAGSSCNVIQRVQVGDLRTALRCFVDPTAWSLANEVQRNQRRGSLLTQWTFNQPNWNPNTDFYVQGGVTVLADGSLFVPASTGRLLTKRRFGDRTRISAVVRPTMGVQSTAQSCIPLRALVPDASSAARGFAGTVAANTQAQSILRFDRGGGNAFANFSIMNPNRDLDIAIDVHGDFGHFYVDGVHIMSYGLTNLYVDGVLGFSDLCQDIIVKSIRVEDMRAPELNVEVKYRGKALRVAGRSVVPDAAPCALVNLGATVLNTRGAAPTKVSQDIPLVLTLSSTRQIEILAVRPSGEPYTHLTPRLCTSLTGGANVAAGYSATCVLNPNLRPGVYAARVRYYYGYTEALKDSFLVEVLPSVRSFTLKPAPTASGALAIVTGTNLPVGEANQNFVATLRGAPCTITFLSEVRVVCQLTAPLAGSTAGLTFSYKGVALPCAFCASIASGSVAPQVTSVTSIATFVNNRVTIVGSGFDTTRANLRVTVDNTVNCPIVGNSATAVICQLPSTLLQSTTAATTDVSVVLSMPTGVRQLRATHTVAPFALTTTDTAFSALGGALVTVSATQQADLISSAPSASEIAVVTADFSRGEPLSDAQWGTAPVSIDDCLLSRSANSYLLGWFSTQMTVAKSFSGLPAHASLIFRTEMLVTPGTDVIVTVDGVPYTFAASEADCALDPICQTTAYCTLPVVLAVPHEAAHAQIGITMNVGGRRLALRFFSVHVSTQSLAQLTGVSASLSSELNPPTLASVRSHFLTFQTAAQSADVDLASLTLTLSRTVGSSAAITSNIAVRQVASSSSSVVSIDAVAVAAASSDPKWVTNGRRSIEVSPGRVSVQTAGWDGSASSMQTFRVSEFQKFSFRVSPDTPDCLAMIGIANGIDTSASYTDINFAFYVQPKRVSVYESGSSVKGSPVIGNNDTTYSIVCARKAPLAKDSDECSAVHYYVNDVLYHVSTERITGLLRLDTSFARRCVFTDFAVETTTPSAPFQTIPVAVNAGGTYLQNPLTSITIDGSPCTLTHFPVSTTAVICALPSTALDMNALHDIRVVVPNFGVWSRRMAFAPVVLATEWTTGSWQGGLLQQFQGLMLGRAQGDSNGLCIAGTSKARDTAFECRLSPAAVTTRNTAEVQKLANADGTAIASAASFSFTFNIKLFSPELANVTRSTDGALLSFAETTVVEAGEQLIVRGSGFTFQTLAPKLYADSNTGAPLCTPVEVSSVTDSSFTCVISSAALPGDYQVMVMTEGGSSSQTIPLRIRPTVDASRSALQVGTVGIAYLDVAGTNLVGVETIVDSQGQSVCSNVVLNGDGRFFRCLVSRTAVAAFSGPFHVRFSNAAVTLALPASTAVDASFSPNVVAMAPSAGLAEGSTVLISGTFLDGDVQASFGDVPCVGWKAVGEVQDPSVVQQYSCVIAAPLAAGVVTPTIVSTKRGGQQPQAALGRRSSTPINAHTDGSVFLMSVASSSTGPSGSLVARIGVSGVDLTQIPLNTITAAVSSYSCAISVVASTVLDCVFLPSSPSFSFTAYDISLSMATETLSLTTTHPISFSTANIPTVTSLDPLFGTAAGGVLLTITGENFDPNPQMTVVMVGGSRCMTQSVSADQTSIVCLTSPAHEANASQIVTVSQYGVGDAANTFIYDAQLSVEFAVTSSYFFVSVEGSALVTIFGIGFVEGDVVVDIEGVPCAVQSVTPPDQVVCVMPPSPRIPVLPRREQDPLDVQPYLVSSYPAHPEGEKRIKLFINGVQAREQQWSEALVVYDFSMTPRSDSIARALPTDFTATTPLPYESIVRDGEILVLEGSSFAESGNVVALQRLAAYGTFSSAPSTSTCEVLEESSTRIVCRLHMAAAGSHLVQVVDPAYGMAYHSLECPSSGQFLMCDGSCLSDSDCSVAEWGIVQSCSDLVQLISGDSYCDATGGNDASRVLRLDNGKPFNMNCPMYSCEGNDCNQTFAGQAVVTCGLDPSGFVVQSVPVISSVERAPYVQSSFGLNGGARLTIHGTSLFLRSTVLVGTVPCIPQTVNGNTLECELLAASPASGLTLTVVTDGVAAECLQDCTGYSFTSVMTPTVTARAIVTMWPPKLTVTFQNNVALYVPVVTNSSVVITLDGLQCLIESVSGSVVTCVLPNQPAWKAGWTISVRFAPVGYATFASGALKTIAMLPLMRGFTPTSQHSTAGGSRITVTGFGFLPNQTQLFANTCPHVVVSSTISTIVATVGPCGSSTSSYALRLIREGQASTTCVGVTSTSCTMAYVATSTPKVNAVTITPQAFGHQTVVLSGTFPVIVSSFVVSIGEVANCLIMSSNATTIVCNATSGSLGGTHPMMLTANPFGNAILNVPALISFPLSVTAVSPSTGSAAGGQVVTVTGVSFGVDASLVKFSFGGSPCVTLSVAQTTATCRTTSGTGTVSIQVTTWTSAGAQIGSAMSTSPLYTYTTAVPTVATVWPTRGSTAGGTILTIVGVNLADTTSVTIAGVACAQTPLDVVRSNATHWICTTGPHATQLTPVPIVVTCAIGNAITTAHYQYIDLWSRITTWGNTHLPVAGNSIVIKEGQRIMMDMSPPKLYLVVIVGGELTFDPSTDVTLECSYLVINHGRFAIGQSIDEPYTKKAVIRLFGDRLSPELPLYGAKVLFMRMGQLDLHGIPRQPVWTLLNRTALPGDNSIVVRGPVDWQPGEELIITPTDFEPLHYERFHIISVTPLGDGSASVVIVLDGTLVYQHYGVRQCFGAVPNTVCVDEIAEVFILNRNIDIVGDATSAARRFGAQIVAIPESGNPDSYARLSSIRVGNAGQRFIPGRYPIHFASAGNISGSFVKGSAIHDTYNRAIGIQGSNYGVFENNVICDVEGHAVFLEEGSEVGNVFKRNVVVATRVSTSNLNSDLQPASFFITNPSNDFYENHAAGSQAYGFWFALNPNSIGASASTTICPVHERLGAFAGQVSHSNGNDGLLIKPAWLPRTGNCNTNPNAEALTQLGVNMTLYKNSIHGFDLAHQFGSIELTGFVSADNGDTVGDASHIWTFTTVPANTNQSQGVSNAVMIAYTANQPAHRAARRRGITLPMHDNWFVKNVTWVNFENENWGVEPFLWQRRHDTRYPHGWHTWFREMQFLNSPNKGYLKFRHQAVYYDQDGTFNNGLAGSFVLPWSPIFDPDHCPLQSTFPSPIDVVSCDPSYIVRRFGYGSANELYNYQIFTIEGRSEWLPSVWHQYLIQLPMNKEVGILWDSWSAPSSFWWRYNPRYMQSTERALFVVKHLEERMTCSATFDNSNVANTAALPPTLSSAESSDFWNNATWEHTVLFARNDTFMKLTCKNCPSYGCPTDELMPPPPPKACTSFGLASSWISGVVPGVGKDVDITFNDSICLDSTIPTFPDIYVGALVVKGRLQFFDSHCPVNGGTVRIYVDRFVQVLGGVMEIGTEAEPIRSCRVEIIMAAVDRFNQTDVIRKTLMPWGQRTFALQFGEIHMFGEAQVSMRRLAAIAAAGTTTLTLEAPVDWLPGDAIGIARTSRDFMWDDNVTDPSESALVSDVSPDGLTVTLASALQNTHWGGAPQTIGATSVFSVGAEVILLTRRIVIRGPEQPQTIPGKREGWLLNLGCSAANYQGCVGTNFMSPNRRGVVHISGVALWNAGQSGFPRRGAVDIDGFRRSDNTESYLRNVSMWFPVSTAIALQSTSDAFEVSDCVVFSANGGAGIEADGIAAYSSSNVLQGNVVMGQFGWLNSASFRIAPRNTVFNNVAASSARYGFITDGEACADPFNWHGNVAHSTRDGLLVYDGLGWSSPARSALCRRVGGILTYGNRISGATLWYVAGHVFVQDFVSVDNSLGLIPILFDPRTDNGENELQFRITDSTFAGRWPDQPCREQYFTCRAFSDIDATWWCANALYQQKIGPMGLIQAVFLSSLYAGRTVGEPFVSYMEPDSYHAVRGKAFVDRVTFDYFEGVTECGTRSAGFFQNIFANDTFHQHLFSNIHWGPFMTPGAELYAITTYGRVSNLSTHGVPTDIPTVYNNFDDAFYGGNWPDAPNKLWIVDLDGTFSNTEQRGHILSSQTITRHSTWSSVGGWNGLRTSTVDIGAVRMQCTRRDDWNAFFCTEQLGFMSLVIDSIATDALRRRAAPVVLCKGDGMMNADGDPLCQNGIVDFVSGPVMKGRTHRLTLERLSRYRFLVENGGNYTLLFRGAPPAAFRVRLIDNEYLTTAPLSAQGIVLNMRLFGPTAQMQPAVYVNGRKQFFTFGLDYPYVYGMRWPGPFDAAGTHYLDKYVTEGFQRNVLSLTVRPQVKLEVKAEPIVSISISLSLSLSAFYSSTTNFAALLAAALGVSSTQVMVANVVAGTVRRQRLENVVNADFLIVSNSTNSSWSDEEAFQVVTSAESLTADGLSDTFHTPVFAVMASVAMAQQVQPATYVAPSTAYLQTDIALAASTQWDTATAATSIAAFLAEHFATRSNATTSQHVVIGNLVISSSTVQCTIVVAYDGSSDPYKWNGTAAVQFLHSLSIASLNQQAVLPQGYSFASLSLQMNDAYEPGTMTQVASPPPPPPATPAPAPQGTPSPSSNNNNNNNNGRTDQQSTQSFLQSTAFIGIAAAVGGVLIIVVVLVVWRLLRNGNNNAVQQPLPQDSSDDVELGKMPNPLVRKRSFADGGEKVFAVAVGPSAKAYRRDSIVM